MRGAAASALRAVAWLEETLAMLFLLVIAVVINLQVVSRYVMDDPFIWPEEISRIAMVWASWWAIAAVTRRGFHIRFDTLLTALPRRVGQALDAVVDLIALAFFGFLAWHADRLIDTTAGLELAATELPTSLLVWPVLFGCALAALHCVLRLVDRVLGREVAIAGFHS